MHGTQEASAIFVFVVSHVDTLGMGGMASVYILNVV